MPVNQFHQPIGEPVTHFHGAAAPAVKELMGQYCRLERLSSSRHLQDLYDVYGPDSPLENWTYLNWTPVDSLSALKKHLDMMAATQDPYHFAIIDTVTNKAVGTVAYMRVFPSMGSIEVGYVVYSDALKKTRIATEAQFLLMQHAFEDLGYRRYEWKCDALNAPSRNAALRLGFTFEGTFRQALVYKGRNRDTDWFSIIDSEWTGLKEQFQQWLIADNFDADGQQRHSLCITKRTLQ